MSYAYTTDGVKILRRERLPEYLNGATRDEREAAGYYDLEATMPTSEHGEIYVASGYERTANGYKRLWTAVEPSQDEKATEADKDAALARLGVDMTEA